MSSGHLLVCLCGRICVYSFVLVAEDDSPGRMFFFSFFFWVNRKSCRGRPESREIIVLELCPRGTRVYGMAWLASPGKQGGLQGGRGVVDGVGGMRKRTMRAWNGIRGEACAVLIYPSRCHTSQARATGKTRHNLFDYTSLVQLHIKLPHICITS